MRKTIGIAMLALLALAGQLLAGGFFLQLGNPEAIPEARKLDAVLVVKADRLSRSGDGQADRYRHRNGERRAARDSAEGGAAVGSRDASPSPSNGPGKGNGSSNW